jgi:hypothetical protein
VPCASRHPRRFVVLRRGDVPRLHHGRRIESRAGAPCPGAMNELRSGPEWIRRAARGRRLVLSAMSVAARCGPAGWRTRPCRQRDRPARTAIATQPEASVTIGGAACRGRCRPERHPSRRRFLSWLSPR